MGYVMICTNHNKVLKLYFIWTMVLNPYLDQPMK